MFTNVTVRALAAAVAMALVAACSSGDDADDAEPAEAATTDTDEGGTPAVPGPWVVEAPEDHGLDPATLEEARTYAFADGRNTQGVVVVLDGVIVAEWYADGAGPDSWVASWSVPKSFASATVGIAIEEGKIPSVDEYATEVLFEPLGLERAEWWRDGEAHTLTYCCFDSTSRDFARFGQLYLQNGLWGDEQVVLEDWVEDSLVPSAASEEADEPYGYQWWLGEPEGIDEDVFAAVGHDGQWIYVIPVSTWSWCATAPT